MNHEISNMTFRKDQTKLNKRAKLMHAARAMFIKFDKFANTLQHDDAL